MSQSATDHRVREAVGVFNDVESLEAAIDELESSGFSRAELSLVAGEGAVREKLGHMYFRVEEVEDDPDVARAAWVSTESRGDAEGALIGTPLYIAAVAAAGAVVATGGTFAAAIAAAVAGGAAGGALGGILAAVLEKHHADYLQQQIDRGGLLLWVNLRDDAHMERAIKILETHSAHDVHVHRLPA